MIKNKLPQLWLTSQHTLVISSSIKLTQLNICERVTNLRLKSLWTLFALNDAFLLLVFALPNSEATVLHAGCSEGCTEWGAVWLSSVNLPNSGNMDPCGALRHVCTCGLVQLNSRHFVQFRPCVSLWSTCCGQHVVVNMLWSTYCGQHVVVNVLWSTCCVPTSALRHAVRVIHKLLHVSAPRCHLQGALTGWPAHLGCYNCVMMALRCRKV